MGNTEKKLDALIDALGFDVEEVESTVVGYSRVTLGVGGNIFSDLPPKTEPVYVTNYKVTKRDSKPSIEDVVLSASKELVAQCIKLDLPVGKIVYKGFTIAYNKDKEEVEISHD